MIGWETRMLLRHYLSKARARVRSRASSESAGTRSTVGNSRLTASLRVTSQLPTKIVGVNAGHTVSLRGYHGPLVSAAEIPA